MPVLTARGAGVRQRRRWLFRDLEVTVEPGEIVAVVGPPGSGRTTMLLALARRFRLSEGRVEAGGPIALGQVPEVSAPEPVFTVGEHVRERLALLGRKRRAIAEVDLHGLDPQAKGRDLTPYERQVLGLVLAQLSEPAMIALDGLDDGLDAAEQAALLRRLSKIAAGGTAVLLTARDMDPSAVTTVIHLAGHRPAALTADDTDAGVDGAPGVPEKGVAEPEGRAKAECESEPESEGVRESGAEMTDEGEPERAEGER